MQGIRNLSHLFYHFAQELHGKPEEQGYLVDLSSPLTLQWLVMTGRVACDMWLRCFTFSRDEQVFAFFMDPWQVPTRPPQYITDVLVICPCRHGLTSPLWLWFWGSLGRAAISRYSKISAVTTSNKFWSFGHGRLLNAQECCTSEFATCAIFFLHKMFMIPHQQTPCYPLSLLKCEIWVMTRES